MEYMLNGRNQHIPAISIVIPAFNAEATLVDLVEDCLAQTFRNIEVICVDDGSDDDTCSCIVELARKHACVRSLSIKHEGPTAARAAGTDVARSEWVIFADADDRLEPTWIESLITGGHQVDPLGTADIIAGANCWDRSNMDPENIDADHKHIQSESRGLFPCGPRMDKVWKRMLGCAENGTSISHSMCDKLFRIDLARSVFKGIDRSIRIGEDTCFNIVAFARARAVALTYATGYRWTNTRNSLSYTPPLYALQDNRVVYAHAKKELLANGYGEYAATLWYDWMSRLAENQLWRLCGNTEVAKQLADRFMSSYEATASE